MKYKMSWKREREEEGGLDAVWSHKAGDWLSLVD